jgi:transcriptional regulator with GAF, ATPase, and Fis domain
MLYSIWVLAHVAWMGTIGVRCMFGTTVEEEIPGDYAWNDERPQKGDELLSIGGHRISESTYVGYADYIRAMRGLRQQIGQTIEVRWRDQTSGTVHLGRAKVQRPPIRTWVWSFIWFVQELLIFGIGARVFWKRPNDDSALLFFVLCIVTVGAFMGGYHWTEIVFEPALIYLFALFAVFVPVVNLHFYLVFPRPNPILLRHRRGVLGALYGASTAYLLLLWGSMRLAGWLSLQGHPMTTTAFGVVRGLSLGYVGLAFAIFLVCVMCLGYSSRNARTRAERNQVKWILAAAVVAAVLITYLLIQVWHDPATLGRDNAAWPMFGVSLLFTVAHAFSITRYKLMQVEDIINRSAVYFVFSLIAGLIYSGMLLVGGKLIGDRLFAAPHSTSLGAVVAGLSVVVVLTLFEVARGRFQRVIDRRFFREKYKFDEAMHKMRLAVGSLIDRTTLGRRLLEAASEVLRLEWGALYLLENSGNWFRLTACHGPTPDEKALASDNPLVARLHETPTVRLSHATALNGGADAVSDAMIALGGEAAAALGSDGVLAGLLVLGPKRSGMPYENEELAFLGALSSVAALVLHSADIQETLESLNQELRDKVDKIAEQQRRILILQEQLRDRAGRESAAQAAEPGDLSHPADVDGDPGVFEAIKGSGPAVRRMIAMARKVAASPSAVLIRGESGTGKELLAAAIHRAGPRAARPFVKVHCAALSQSLLESELFGHVKGAFTGADRDRVGRFEQANGGTLFLDEIGDINLEVQTKLLRVLQEMSFERVGSSQPITVDVRILAATHQDLQALIRAGRFREDLYYRLNVIPLHAPALRERREDIFELAVCFLNLQAQRTGKPVTHLDPEAVEALAAYDWPGNIRELENVIERAVVLADGPAVMLDDLPAELRQVGRRGLRPRLPAPARARAGRPRGPATIPVKSASVSSSGRGTVPARTLPTPDGSVPPDEAADGEFVSYERQWLLDALDEAHGNKSNAARLLGIPRSTFFSKLRKHGIA